MDRARIGRWLLAVVVVLSALGLGALQTPILALCATLAAVATGLLWLDAPPLESRPAATVLVLTACGLIAWTALQLVPLPRGMLAAIASENADVWARCLLPLREDGPAWAPISLDPNATRVQVLRGVTYLVVLAGALRVARHQDGVVFFERVLVASSLVTAGAALLHPALGARKVFGLYEPAETWAFDPQHLGPLLNTNHLAAYLNIGAIIAFASVLERREALPRPVAAVVVLLLAPTVVWTLSRGGVAAMILGIVLTALLAFGARRSRRTHLAGRAAMVLAACGGSTVILLAVFEEAKAKVVQGDLSKLGLVKNAFVLLGKYGVLGVGRGAFESTFPQVRTASEYWVNTHPENVVAQWTTEWGVPVSLAALLAIGWALRPRTALARSRAPAGAWAALVAAFAHNLVDFSSEVPGVVIALTVCAAIVAGGTGGGEPAPHRGGAWSRHPRELAIGLAVATVIAIGITLPFAGRELNAEQRAIRDAALDRTTTLQGFHARIREAMLRHPAEAYLPFVGAVRATVAHDESIFPWVSRALERSPVYGRAHLLIARSLYVRNPSQARLEYRLACQQDSQVCRVEEAVKLVGGFEDALELVPEGPRAATVLTYVAESIPARLPASAVQLDRVLAERDPNALPPIRRAAAAALADLRQNEAWCDGGARASCVAEGQAAARRVRDAAPDRCEGHALVAELREASGEPDAAFAELAEALDRVQDRSGCAQRLVRLAANQGGGVRLETALDRLLKIGCTSTDECVDNFVFASRVETERGSSRRAFTMMKKAWERAPERENLLVEVARQADALKLHGEALEAYTKLAERHPEEAKWREGVAREKAAVARGVFDRLP